MRSHTDFWRNLDDTDYLQPLIDEICSSDLPSLPGILERNMQWNFPQGELSHWVRVLNFFDDILEKQITKYDLSSDHPKLQLISPEDSRLLVSCLRFTNLLLESAEHKNFYNSSERIFQLILTPSIDVRLAALEVALSLGERYSLSNSFSAFSAPKPVRLKALEIAKAYPPPIPTSFLQNRLEVKKSGQSGIEKKDHFSWVDALDPKQKCPSKWKSLTFEYYSTSASTEKERKSKAKDKKKSSTNSKTESGLLSYNLSEDQVRKMSITQIFERASDAIPDYSCSAFSLHALNSKAFNTNSAEAMELRAKLTRMKCLAIAFVVSFCSTEFTSCQLFEVEPYTLSFLMDLVSPENMSITSSDIFYDAMRTIKAIALKRVWGSELVRHLGGNVNHGLLYQILRHINKQVRIYQNNSYELGYRSFMSIINELVDSKTLAPRLVAGGLLSELTSVIDIKTENRWLGSAAVRILAVLITSFPNLGDEFADQGGFALLIDAFDFEVDFALKTPALGDDQEKGRLYHTISFKQVKHLKNLHTFVSNLISSDVGDRLRNLFDSPLLLSFNKILLNPQVFGPEILAATLYLVAQIIHNEPTAFSILREANLVDIILDKYESLFVPSEDLILALLEVLEALALNKDGLDKVIRSNALHTFFQSFLKIDFAKELLRNDMCSNLGCTMDELGRHNPQLRPIIMQEIRILVESTPPVANIEMRSIKFYTSPKGNMYLSRQDHADLNEDGQGEIDSWDSMKGSFIIDNVFGFLNGLLQDTGQWGKDVIKEIEFSSWEAFFTMPNVGFDFTASDDILNLVAVVKYLNDEVQSYGFPQILETFHKRLESDLVKEVISQSTNASYFLSNAGNEAKLTAVLQELNVLNCLLYAITEIYLNPTSMFNETYLALFNYLQDHMSMVESLVGLLRFSINEEIFIRTALPDEVVDITAASLFVTAVTFTTKICSNKPIVGKRSNSGTSAKFKNTLQLRFLMDQFQGRASMILACIARSCMHRRQDYFSDEWRRSSVIATRRVVIALSAMFASRFELDYEKQLNFEILAITDILYISKFKDRGKEVISTSFLLSCFNVTNLIEQFVDCAISAFDKVCEFPATEIEKYTDKVWVSTSDCSISVSIFDKIVPLLTRLLVHGVVNKFPFTMYFFNREYCSNESLIIKGITSQVVAQSLRLISHVLGLNSKAHINDDYSTVLSQIPHETCTNIIDLVQYTWSAEYIDEFYPLDEDKMTPATGEIDFLTDTLKIDKERASSILHFAKSIHNIKVISPSSVESDFEDWAEYQEKLNSFDLSNLFQYPALSTGVSRFIKETKEKESETIYFHAILEIAAIKDKIAIFVSEAYVKYGVSSSLTEKICAAIKNLVSSGDDSKLQKAARLTSLLEQLILDSLSNEDQGSLKFAPTFHDFVDFFLISLEKSPQLINTDFAAASLSICRPILSLTSPLVFESLEPVVFDLHGSNELNSRLSRLLLDLEPSENVKVAECLCQILYFLAKFEEFKKKIIKSKLLKTIMKNMIGYLKTDQADNSRIQNNLIVVIRTCFESGPYLKKVFSSEIIKQFKKHSGKKLDMHNFLIESRCLFGRDPYQFVNVASDMVRLDNYDGRSTSNEKIILINHLNNGLTPYSAQSVPDIEMSDPIETKINPSGLVHSILSQLMNAIKEDWFSTPENTKDSTIPWKFGKKKEESDYDFLVLNKQFAHICFLLRTLCELVGSYNEAKLEFITFTKKLHVDEMNKPRMTSLNFFLHQLIPSNQLCSPTGPEHKRRDAISSLAKLTLLALVSTTVLPEDKEPDPRQEDADMAIVRKLTVDIISKILRETMLEPTLSSKNYSKVYDILDLCSCLLSTKFRELCFPLLSKSATKFDQFYIASAYIDAQLSNQIASVLSQVDMNFPEINKITNVGLKTLSSLAKIKTANADLFESFATGEKEEDDMDDVDEKDETPDFFRNSTLGMYDIDLDSDEEEEFYQDQPLEISESDISDDNSENSDEMSYSEIDSEAEEGDEMIEEDEEEMGEFEGYDSDISNNDIEIIEDLDIHSESDSQDEGSEMDDFVDFDHDTELGTDSQEESDNYDDDNAEQEEYDEAELNSWLEAFADPEEQAESQDRSQDGNPFGNESAEESSFSFDSEPESGLDSEEGRTRDSILNRAGSTRESLTSFFNALRPIGLSVNPSGLFEGTIQIGTTRGNDSQFPQLDDSLRALLHDKRHPKSTFDHMLIRSTTERWLSAYEDFGTRRYGPQLINAAHSELKNRISDDSIRLFKKKTEERERIRKERQEKAERAREENRIKREQEEAARQLERNQRNDESHREPVMLWIGNREVDIGGTDIDPEFFEALPEDMREEVFTQHVRARRADANNTGHETREIDPDFLDALPEQIRNDILQQESVSRRFSQNAFGFFDEEYDDEDDINDDLADEDELELAAGTIAQSDPNAEGQATKKKKKKLFSVPLIDRAGTATIVKLLFLPRPINQRDHIYQTLASVCNNKQTRSDVISLLVQILHDGLMSQKSLEKTFDSITTRAHSSKFGDSKFTKDFPMGATPIIVGVQVIEALLYLIEKNAALRIFLLTEHENPFLAKKQKRLKLKKSIGSEEKYPINLLIGLLDNPLLSNEHFFVDLLASVLHHATRPLLMTRDKQKSTPSSFSTNFIPEKNLCLIISILASNECINSTFRNTISAMHHISLLKNAQDVFSRELSEKAGSLGNQIVVDLKNLTEKLSEIEVSETDENSVVQKFTASSSDQAKLLRILTALDYMYESKKRDRESSEAADKMTQLTGLYKQLHLGNLWKALSDCLRTLEENPSVSHIVTALLPLIEALMVVCKHSRVKELPIKDVMKYEVKRIDYTKEPIENLFFSFTDEHKKILNQMVRTNPNLMSGPFSMLVKNSRVLEFDNKRNYFNRQLHDDKEEGSKMSVNIRRDQVFLDSYRALFFKSVEQFKKAHLEINFQGEAGVDAGGVTREWYQVLSRQMFNPDYALFTAVASDENTYHPNRTSYINPEHLSFFKFIGRTIGKAIYDGWFLDCHFSRAVYKKILDRPVSLKDMENLDLEYYKSLMWMLENDITDIITEDFSVETDDYGEHKIIDLVPNGRNIPVTEANKQEYVRLVVEYRLQTSVNEQMSNFIAGFHEIIPADLVAIFDEQELELLISGLPDIDVQDWQNNTTYNNYSASSEQIQWFWRAVKSFDNEERAKLLQFSTGTSKVPLNGFKDLRGANGICKFSIHRDYGPKDRLPSSHTCFNQIDLPVYDSYETLRGSLLLAVSEGHEGFQLA